MVRRRETWPQDRALLALRVATILLAGLAFAGPALSARPIRGTRIVAVDTSAATATDSAAHYLRASDLRIPFNGSLSAALIAARRSVARLREDSVELVVVSPFAVSAIDAATAALRRQWPAAIRPVRVTAPPRLAHHAIVHWAPPAGAIDTVGAIILDGRVSVAPFTRAREYHPPEGAVIARWVDGAPAAADRIVGDSCERDVAVGIPDREPWRAAITNRPCGMAIDVALSDSAVRAFAGIGPFSAKFGPNQNGGGDRTLMTVLLVLAGALAMAEWVIRK